MGLDNWLLLSKLRRPVKKLQFLLSFNTSRLRLASSIGMSSKRRLSFNDSPGLRCCSDDIESDEWGSLRGLQRTMSYHSDGDIDGRADHFIANFYRQLEMERQVSLQLRYCRGNSLESGSSDSQ